MSLHPLFTPDFKPENALVLSKMSLIGRGLRISKISVITVKLFFVLKMVAVELYTWNEFAH